MGISDTEILARMQQLTGPEFEHFIAKLWDRRGFDTAVTATSGDRGIDVIAEREVPYPEKTLIQTKRYSDGNKVKSREIQQYHSIRDQRDNVDKVIVVTTSRFSGPAVELAEDLNVKYINGNSLADMIREMGAEDLVKEYTSPPSDAEKAPSSSLDSPSQGQTNQEVEPVPSDESDGLAAELTGLRWVEAEVTQNSGGIISTGNKAPFAGYIATFRLFGRDQEWNSLIEFPEEVSLVTRSGEQYHPLTLPSNAVPSGWQTHASTSPTGRAKNVEIPKNSRCDYFAAFSVPRSTEIDEIRISRYDISIGLNDEMSSQMRNLPLDIDELA